MLRHDQDPRFMSEVFTRFRERLGTKQSATLACRPQVNGQQERSVQTMVRSIRTYVAEADQNDWDDHEERLVFALNTAFDSTRLFTPFYLVHGWDANSTISAMLGPPPTGLEQKSAYECCNAAMISPMPGLETYRSKRNAFVSKHKLDTGLSCRNVLRLGLRSVILCGWTWQEFNRVLARSLRICGMAQSVSKKFVMTSEFASRSKEQVIVLDLGFTSADSNLEFYFPSVQPWKFKYLWM
ncbi:hypothetical protein PI125_g13452 [Phytophthora idaei]|nr:hypothetical protein PI125_g13452 [Phytophthora idaei]